MPKTKRVPVVVNKKFLNDLAREIYDPKTKEYLRLCGGTLQNGPDPEDKRRPMHCGLGELYFKMTGTQPKSQKINECAVVDLAVELSTLSQEKKRALAAIEAMDVGEDVKDVLADAIDNTENKDEAKENWFCSAIKKIQEVNDDHNNGKDAETVFKNRAKRVAAQIRRAAKILRE